MIKKQRTVNIVLDIFFTTKRRYYIKGSIENIRADIESAIDRKWHDFSINLSGHFIDSNTFIITPKWSFAIIQWIERDLTYLKGKLSIEGNKTFLDTTLRPNSLFVFIFYFFALLSLSESIGIMSISKGDPVFKFLFFPLFTFIIVSIILFSKFRMKKRFERILNLH